MAVAVAAIMVHVPGTLLLVHYLGFAGAGWAVVVMRSAHLFFTVGESAMCTTRIGKCRVTSLYSHVVHLPVGVSYLLCLQCTC